MADFVVFSFVDVAVFLITFAFLEYFLYSDEGKNSFFVYVLAFAIYKPPWFCILCVILEENLIFCEKHFE